MNDNNINKWNPNDQFKYTFTSLFNNRNELENQFLTL